MKSPFGFKSVIELVSYFKDEQNCWDYLEESKWKGHITCRKCGGDKIYKFKNGKQYKCGSCGDHFTAKIGTIFQDSKIPLIKWFIAMHYMGNTKKGLSTRQLAAEINVSQRTAWFMQHRIRVSFKDFEDKLDKVIAVDETFIGGRNKNRHMDKRIAISRDRTYPDKTPVVGMVTMEGKLKCVVVPDTKLDTLTRVISNNVVPGSVVVTDEWVGYKYVERDYFHEVVDHKSRKYISECGFSTNRIEGFWTHLKKSIVGIYHKVSKKHLQRFVNESVFRYNFRGLPNHVRLHAMMQNIHGTLKYKQLISNEKAA